jgi:Bacteriophage protein gp37
MLINATDRNSIIWNPWHGCSKLSAGCANCYVYRRDNEHGIDSAAARKTQNFDLPARRKRNGEYKIHSGTCVYTCFASDFADCRLPIYRAAPVKRKAIICEPLLERIDLRPHEMGAWIGQVAAGGESGDDARVCNFYWILELRDLCVENNIKRELQQSQAKKAGIDFGC